MANSNLESEPSIASDGTTQPITGPINLPISRRESNDNFTPADQTLPEIIAASLLKEVQTEFQLGPEGSSIKFYMESALGSELTPQQIITIQATRESYQKLWTSPFVPAEVSESIIWNPEEDESKNVLHQIVRAYDEATGTETTIVMRIFLVDINSETENVPSDLTNWQAIFTNRQIKNLLEIIKDQLDPDQTIRVGICSRLASHKDQKVKKNVNPEIRKQRRSLTTTTAYALMTQQTEDVNIWSYTVTEELIESVLAAVLADGSKLKLPFQTSCDALKTIFRLDNIQQIKLVDNEEIRFLKRYFAGYWIDPISIRKILERFKTQEITFTKGKFIHVIIEYFITINNLIVNELKTKGSVGRELLEIKEKFISVGDIIQMLSIRKYMHLLTPLFIQYPEFENLILSLAEDGCISVTMLAEDWNKGLVTFFENINELSPLEKT